MRFTLSLNRSSTGLHRSVESSFTGAALHAAHLSLAQVEKLSGIPANIIDLLEVGIKPVDLGHLHQLAKAYGKAVKITLI